MRARSVFYVVSAVLFLWYVHGVHAVWPILIATFNFLVVGELGKTKYTVIATWAFNLVFLVLTDYYNLSQGTLRLIPQFLVINAFCFFPLLFSLTTRVFLIGK